MALDDWFAIFRAGEHTDSAGREAAFSRADLDAIADGYDAGSSSCVITHESLYSPFGYARIAELRRDGDLLQARCDPESVEPRFAALVEAGRLHSRSVQLLPRAGGGHRLGHVAFLGAEPPAVEGLAPISMSAAALTFATEDPWEEVDEARRWTRVLRALRSLAEKVFGDDADGVVSQWEIDDAAESAGAARQRAIDETEGVSVSEYSQQDLDAARAEGRTEVAAERERLAAERLELERGRVQGRIDTLVEAGRITPAQASGMAEFCVGLDSAAELRFSRGEGASAAAVETTPSDWFFSFLDSLPEGVRAGRRDLGDPPAAEGDSTAIARAAREYQASERAKGRSASIFEAVDAVSRAAG